MDYELKFSRYNECSILIEWPAVMDENMLKDILDYKKSIQNSSVELVVEVINTFNSLLIIYDLTIDNVYGEILRLKSLKIKAETIEEASSKLWRIPVCYDADFGIDLEAFSKEKQLSKNEVIELHSSAIYTIFFIGFLPGFLYLGGLNKKLHLDRKSTPNLDIKKGSVGIGGNQTGIYPKNSPGGWHIIGKTPVDFFNAKSSPPCVFNAGDKLQFFAISKTEFLDLEQDVKNNKFQLTPELYA
ncbi:5-oxoprolinase subunit PxpB [Winogradskyella marincola]|uniref:5-oxoprolinase subunit PxpB n=1 Tax=Winogradskyella marincola TaxID=3037795 RepID=A0ABT6G037_9FLAO|nr:5-oxoprolinase subunit PxpB [Winogradskyella sp. YYF002]MDG4715407.1 5-oxoprolinase subunit PxpB [Winogradskyella sp. YYF002]